MEAVWVLVAICMIVLTILLAIMIYYKYFKRRTTIGMLAEKTRKLQDKNIRLEEELELRQMDKELEENIATNKKEIDKLKPEN